MSFLFRPWQFYISLSPSADIPNSIRIVLAIFSGAVSVSVLPWFSSGACTPGSALRLLLVAILIAACVDCVRLRISSRINFCADVRAMDCGSSVRARRNVDGRGLGRAPSDWHHLGHHHRCFRVGRPATIHAQRNTGAFRSALFVGLHRSNAGVSTRNQLSMVVTWLSSGGESGAGSDDNDYGNLRNFISW